MSSEPTAIHTLIREQRKAQRINLLAASACACAVSVAAVVLLGLSAWFLTASAIAGLAGPLIAQAFNYMIPSAMIRLMAIVRTGARYGERITGHNAALNALAGIRPRLFSAIAGSRPEISLSLSSGEASARLMQDVDAVQNHFVRLSAPWAAGMGMVTGMILCAFAGWPAAAVVAAVTGLYIAVSRALALRLTSKAGQQVRLHAGAFKNELSSLMAAAPELRAYGKTDWAISRIANAAAPYDEAQRKLASGQGWLSVAQTVAMALAVAGVVATTSSGSPALMAMALLGSIAVLDASGNLVAALGQHSSVEAALARLDPLVKGDEGSSDAPPLKPLIAIAGLDPLRTRSRLAIVGPSGIGKTSLIEQLMALRAAPQGFGKIDGQDIADLNAAQVRSLFAYAPQQPDFINGSIAENLRLGAPKASDDELWAALDDACLSQRINASPKGLAMPVGENGRFLSGGERRRLGLARAYLRKAPFIVLDEPTEGLDGDTERLIVERLNTRLNRSGQGLILISHRAHPLTLCRDRATVSGRDSHGRVQVKMTTSSRSETCVV